MSRVHAIRAGLTTAIFGLPLLASAKTFAELVNTDIVGFGNKVIELLYALCFIFFLIGIVRTLFSENAEKRAQGRQLAIWGTIAFVALFAVWGFVHFMLGILDTFNT